MITQDSTATSTERGASSFIYTFAHERAHTVIAYERRVTVVYERFGVALLSPSVHQEL